MKKNKTIHHMSLILVLFFSMLFSAGCVTHMSTKAPQGFAPYEKGKDFYSVSPDGVMFRVRTAENEPFAELPFWKTALKNHMTKSGYHFTRETDLDIGLRKGYLLELSAPVGEQDFTYLIALCLKDKEIVIIEASGEVKTFKTREKDILDAIKKIGM